MQFPGMSTDPVRLSLEVTWWPPADDFSLSRRLWTRPHNGDTWQLEDMATTASPIGLVTLPDRWRQANADAFAYFLQLVESNVSPF